jgi:hypothetical protein
MAVKVISIGRGNQETAFENDILAVWRERRPILLTSDANINEF